MDLVDRFPSFARRWALLGTGSGAVALAAVLARGGGTGWLPAAPASLTALTVPFVSLLALVGPTGLQFPCWAVESSSPGARAYRWARRRLGH